MGDKELVGRWVRTGLWFVFAFLFLASLPYRAPHLDDAWLGEQAYRLAQDGVVRSNLFQNYGDWGERIWVFHKLFLPQGALVIDLFGWSLPALKAVSLPWFAAAVFLLVRHLKGARERFGPTAVALVPLLFLAHPLVVDYAFTFRPELCLTAVGLGSYLLLERALRAESRWALWASASLAGICVLVHLNGLMFVVAGAGALLVQRRRGDALRFLLLATVLASLYVSDALLAGELSTLREQFVTDPSLDDKDFAWTGAFVKLLREPQRWIRHGEDVATSVLFLFSSAMAGRRLWREHRTLLVYLLAAIVSLGLLSQSKTPKYLVPLLPLVFLVVGVGLEEVEGRGRSTRRVALIVLGLCATVFVTRSARYRSAVHAPLRHEWVLERVPLDEPALVDLTYVFDGLLTHDLRGLWAYRIEAEAAGVEFDLAWLLGRASEDGIRYVVLDPERNLSRMLFEQWPIAADTEERWMGWQPSLDTFGVFVLTNN